VGSTVKALSRAAMRAALASMQLLQAADQVAAEQDSLEGGSLKVGVEGGVGTSALFRTPCFVWTIIQNVAVNMDKNNDRMYVSI
jgi:hypothetical protein